MPAATMTYNTLVADIENYAERHDAEFLAQIPRFIMMAEARLMTEFRGLGTKKFATGFLSVGNPVLSKPASWRETASWNFGTGATLNNRKFLLKRPYEFCRSYWPDPTVTGLPKYYSDYDFNHFLVVPTPDQAYPFELSYFEKIPALSDVVQTNWFTENSPSVLLYGAFVEAMTFCKNDQRIALAQDAFTRSVKALNWEDLRRDTDQSTTPSTQEA